MAVSFQTNPFKNPFASSAFENLKPKVNQETGGFLVCLDDLVNGVYYWDSDIMDWRELDKKVIP